MIQIGRDPASAKPRSRHRPEPRATKPRPLFNESVLDIPPSSEVHISPAAKNERRMIDYTPEPDVYMTRNQPLKFIVMDLWETPLAQISFPENLDQANYDVVARVRQPRVNYCGRSSGK